MAMQVKPNEKGSYLAFREIASDALGLRDDDEVELIPLATVLEKIEDLYSQEVARFEVAAERLKREEHFFQELETALDKFCARLGQIVTVPQQKAAILRCVPLEDVILKTQPRSEAHHR